MLKPRIEKMSLARLVATAALATSLGATMVACGPTRKIQKGPAAAAGAAAPGVSAGEQGKKPGEKPKSSEPAPGDASPSSLAASILNVSFEADQKISLGITLSGVDGKPLDLQFSAQRSKIVADGTDLTGQVGQTDYTARLTCEGQEKDCSVMKVTLKRLKSGEADAEASIKIRMTQPTQVEPDVLGAVSGDQERIYSLLKSLEPNEERQITMSVAQVEGGASFFAIDHSVTRQITPEPGNESTSVQRVIIMGGVADKTKISLTLLAHEGDRGANIEINGTASFRENEGELNIAFDQDSGLKSLKVR